MKRWYYTFFINYNRISVYESADYGGVGGYETEAEARKAANSFIDSEIQKILSKIEEHSKNVAGYSNDLKLVLQSKEDLNEIS